MAANDYHFITTWRIAGTPAEISAALGDAANANHRWAMRRGEESLQLELARRRALHDPIALAAIPSPPGPTFPHSLRAAGRR